MLCVYMCTVILLILAMCWLLSETGVLPSLWVPVLFVRWHPSKKSLCFCYSTRFASDDSWTLLYVAVQEKKWKVQRPLWDTCVSMGYMCILLSSGVEIVSDLITSCVSNLEYTRIS